MNLYDFEEQIPSRIIDRGYDYWMEGRVMIESEDESTYKLIAEGSERYEVIVTLTGIDIDDSDCDCPYMKGHCKHEVAAYFLLREKVAVPSNRKINQQLQNLSKQQLVDLLVGLASDPQLYPRIARSFDTSHKSFDQVIREMRRRFSEKFPVPELDYMLLPRFQSFINTRISDVLIVQDPEMRLKQGISLLIAMSDYDFEEVTELSWETADELNAAVCSAIDAISNEAILVELVNVLKAAETWMWSGLHMDLLTSLASVMKHELHVLHEYVERYRDTEEDGLATEDVETLLQMIEKRLDS